MNEVLLEGILMQLKALDDKIDTLADRITNLTETLDEVLYRINTEDRYDGLEVDE
mgnify:FL=1